jgi:hypothetical protein
MIRAEERTMTNKQAMLVNRLPNLCSLGQSSGSCSSVL